MGTRAQRGAGMARLGMHLLQRLQLRLESSPGSISLLLGSLQGPCSLLCRLLSLCQVCRVLIQAGLQSPAGFPQLPHLLHRIIDSGELRMKSARQVDLARGCAQSALSCRLRGADSWPRPDLPTPAGLSQPLRLLH